MSDSGRIALGQGDFLAQMVHIQKPKNVPPPCLRFRRHRPGDAHSGRGMAPAARCATSAAKSGFREVVDQPLRSQGFPRASVHAIALSQARQAVGSKAGSQKRARTSCSRYGCRSRIAVRMRDRSPASWPDRTERGGAGDRAGARVASLRRCSAARAPLAKKRSSSARRYSPCQGAIGDRAGGASSAACERGPLFRRSRRRLRRAPCRTAPRRAAAPAPARRRTPPRRACGTRLSGSSPAGSVARLQRPFRRQQGQRQFRRARAAARRRRRRRRSTAQGRGTCATVRSSCSAVSAVPSGATAPPNPAWAAAITSI